MKTISTASLVLVALSAPAWAASAYTDGATAEWFKELTSPYAPNCCDQSDCHLAKADFRKGAWWAVSNRTGQWVRIEDTQITATVSVFPVAVLCEGEPYLTYGQDGESPFYDARVYCFAPPPIGF